MKNFWFDHVVYLEDGKQKIRGRYWLFLAAVIYFVGNYLILHLMK